MDSSYRLQATRSKPAALHLDGSSYISASNSNGPQSPTFLYDVPSMSPPTSPTSVRNLGSPTSPSFPGRSRTPRGRKIASPPPGGRNRSETPSRVAQADLEQFAEYCKAWYFTQNEESGRLMTHNLAAVPQSQRAPYSRLQASIRSAYHRSVNVRRTVEFRAHLAATQPGASLLAHSRANPHSHEARTERYQRLERFINTWCTQELPGPHPFFQGLWAVMRLQIIPRALGGAGGNRIDWEIDDAVFKEAAGKEFMQEAIDVLKGVLAFEEVLPSSTSVSNSGCATPTIGKSASQPMLMGNNDAPKSHSKRLRAPSDPFLDTPRRPQMPSSTSGSTLSSMGPPSPLITHYVDEPTLSAISQEMSLEGEEDEESPRIWTSADLTNPEYLHLLNAFPAFITRRTLPRFSASVAGRDLEQGYNVPAQHVRCGTGRIEISSQQRTDGWEGSWWSRFKLWIRRIFC